MTVYVFDTNSFIVIGHYFPEQFPSFWARFDEYVVHGQIVSVREVFNELDGQGNKVHLLEWVRIHRDIFCIPNEDEMAFVNQIFAVPHFQYLVTQKQRLKGTPVADPFVIASAMVRKGCVVTEEDKKEHASRIPNICEHFGIDCTDVKGFMAMEGFRF